VVGVEVPGEGELLDEEEPAAGVACGGVFGVGGDGDGPGGGERLAVLGEGDGERLGELAGGDEVGGRVPAEEGFGEAGEARDVKRERGGELARSAGLRARGETERVEGGADGGEVAVDVGLGGDEGGGRGHDADGLEEADPVVVGAELGVVGHRSASLFTASAARSGPLVYGMRIPWACCEPGVADTANKIVTRQPPADTRSMTPTGSTRVAVTA